MVICYTKRLHQISFIILGLMFLLLLQGGNSYSMSHNPHARNGSNAYAVEISR
jgi:hypothetical protein